jgi:hypothetical protein
MFLNRKLINLTFVNLEDNKGPSSILKKKTKTKTKTARNLWILYLLRTQILFTVCPTETVVLWVLTPYFIVGGYQRFEEMRCLHLQRRHENCILQGM